MKASAQEIKTSKVARNVGNLPTLRRKSPENSELLIEAQEFRRKFREWEGSFQSKAQRMAFIRKLCKRIAEAYKPEKIVLFGSHAYGTPTPESDVDLLIVMDHEGRPVEQMHQIRTELDLVTPLDLVIYSPKEIVARLEDGDMFIVGIMMQGKVMYENKHDRVD